MNRRLAVAAVIWFLFISLVPAEEDVSGHLFIIGGGSRPDAMMKKFVFLSETHGSGRLSSGPSVPET